MAHGVKSEKIRVLFFFILNLELFCIENIFHEIKSVSYNDKIQYTVKPAHVVTSIKQSPVLKGHIFLSCHRTFHMN